ncbi:MAG TPA: hypothetical protein VF988_10750, partial [Verrucomicrobiae bacterium]
SNNPAFASTFALALHLQGHTREGIAALARLNDQSLHQPDVALYYGVLLAAIGESNNAAEYLKIAESKADWLPEEKRLLPNATRESATKSLKP